MKNRRQQIILEIIQQENIETQGQLLEALSQAGIQCTQATISRDIKELRLVKDMNSGGYYRYNAAMEEDAIARKLQTIFRECVSSVVQAQNIVVLRTLPGLASAACGAIDQMELPEVAGTLAGDDTGLIILKDSEAAAHFCSELKNIL